MLSDIKFSLGTSEDILNRYENLYNGKPGINVKIHVFDVILYLAKIVCIIMPDT